MSTPQIAHRSSWKLPKKFSESDQWLDEMGFYRKHMPRDSSCLFRAVSENVYNSQRHFHKVRAECINFMGSNRHLIEASLKKSFDNYSNLLPKSEISEFIEISAMSHLYRRDFVIFEAYKSSQIKMSNGYGHIIFLFYSPETKHFDAVYTKAHISITSFCQSLAYEILYDGVYQMKDLHHAVDKMLNYDKVATTNFECFMLDNVEQDKAKIFVEASPNNGHKSNNTLTLKCKHYTNDIETAAVFKDTLSLFVLNHNLVQLDNVCGQCLNINSAKELLDQGITPFPFKVAKALDPNIYRNIEFDVWTEQRREMRYGARFCDGMQLQVGVKCLCKLEPDQPKPYHCYIQEMTSKRGPCLVFVEELGEKLIVNYDQLELLPTEEVKHMAPLPYRYSQSNSHFMKLGQILSCTEIGTNKTGKLKNGEQDKSSLVRENCDDKAEKCSGDYQHADLPDMDLTPVEGKALSLLVDCGSQGGLSFFDLSQSDDGSPDEKEQIQSGGNTTMSKRMSQPPAKSTSAARQGNTGGASGRRTNYHGLNNYNSMCTPSPPPPGVNLNPSQSIHPSGSDLPMNDIPTLQYYYNVGVKCVWSSYLSLGRAVYANIAEEMQQLPVNPPEAPKQRADKAGVSKSTHRPNLPPRLQHLLEGRNLPQAADTPLPYGEEAQSLLMTAGSAPDEQPPRMQEFVNVPPFPERARVPPYSEEGHSLKTTGRSARAVQPPRMQEFVEAPSFPDRGRVLPQGAEGQTLLPASAGNARAIQPTWMQELVEVPPILERTHVRPYGEEAGTSRAVQPPRCNRANYRQEGNQSHSNYGNGANNNRAGHGSYGGGNRNERGKESYSRNPNSHRSNQEGRSYDDCVVDPQPVPIPFFQYQPQMYSFPYYPLESDPAILDMGGASYVGYEESGVDYSLPPLYASSYNLAPLMHHAPPALSLAAQTHPVPAQTHPSTTQTHPSTIQTHQLEAQTHPFPPPVNAFSSTVHAYSPQLHAFPPPVHAFPHVYSSAHVYPSGQALPSGQAHLSGHRHSSAFPHSIPHAISSAQVVSSADAISTVQASTTDVPSTDAPPTDALPADASPNDASPNELTSTHVSSTHVSPLVTEISNLQLDI